MKKKMTRTKLKDDLKGYHVRVPCKMPAIMQRRDADSFPRIYEVVDGFGRVEAAVKSGVPILVKFVPRSTV